MAEQSSQAAAAAATECDLAGLGAEARPAGRRRREREMRPHATTRQMIRATSGDGVPTRERLAEIRFMHCWLSATSRCWRCVASKIRLLWDFRRSRRAATLRCAEASKINLGNPGLWRVFPIFHAAAEVRPRRPRLGLSSIGGQRWTLLLWFLMPSKSDWVKSKKFPW